MAPSGERVLAGVLLALGVTGCVSTQQQAARLQLNDARIRAGQRPTRVRAAGSTVRVRRVDLIRAGRASAFVVEIANPGSRMVSDLPISLGVRSGRHVLRYLNAGAPAPNGYFTAHLPPIAAGRSITWVYTTGRRLPARARPFALVGATPSIRVRPGRPPGLSVTVRSATPGRVSHRLALAVRNLSSVPQYQLQVYAIGRAGARAVAAGAATVPYLAAHASSQLSLPLLGRVGATHLQAEALATTLP